MKNTTPLVSIVCITYNHEKYISEALDGFLKQKTNFPIEIIVHDDASTDRTADIVREYEKANPELFVCIYQTENQYSKKEKHVWGDITFPLTRGKYIALCEGDDYWTDPYKLEKQVDFLEANLEYAACFHNAKIKWENGSNPIQNFHEFSWATLDLTRSDYRIEDTFKGAFMHTATVLFRRECLPQQFPKWFGKMMSGDLALFSLFTGDKNLKYIDGYMSVYRKHDTSISMQHSGVSFCVNRILMMYELDRYYKSRYLNTITPIVEEYLDMVKVLILLHNQVISYENFRCIVKIKANSNFIDKQTYKIIVRNFLVNSHLKAIMNPVLNLRSRFIAFFTDKL